MRSLCCYLAYNNEDQIETYTIDDIILNEVGGQDDLEPATTN